MAEGHHHQHHLEYGGSPVGTEFDGSLQFRLVDRIPHIAVSHDFTAQTARQVRYALIATVGPERPYYHRWHYVVLDVRMIGGWEEGSGDFVGALHQRMNKIGGELFLVTTDGAIPVPKDVPRYETAEEAIVAAKRLRAERRAASLRA